MLELGVPGMCPVCDRSLWGQSWAAPAAVSRVPVPQGSARIRLPFKKKPHSI